VPQRRLLTPEETDAFHRSVADEERFDRALGQLLRQFTLVEDCIDGMLVEIVARPSAAESFREHCISGRTIGPKLRMLRATMSELPDRELGVEGLDLLSELGELVTKRNHLVHSFVSVGRPATGSTETPFTVLVTRGRGGAVTYSATEVESLVGEAEDIYLRLHDLRYAIQDGQPSL
jgi:hypothetical protein